MFGRLLRTTDVKVVFRPSSNSFQLNIQGHPLGPSDKGSNPDARSMVIKTGLLSCSSLC